MITQELEKIKPPKYTSLVQSHLKTKEILYSKSYISMVYNGKRKNLIVANAIVYVFNKHKEQQKNLTKKIKSLTN